MWGFRVRSSSCFAVLCVLSSFAIILLVALLLLCSECHVTVIALWLFFSAVGWSVVCDQAFPGHTYFLKTMIASGFVWPDLDSNCLQRLSDDKVANGR